MCCQYQALEEKMHWCDYVQHAVEWSHHNLATYELTIEGPGTHIDCVVVGLSPLALP